MVIISRVVCLFLAVAFVSTLWRWIEGLCWDFCKWTGNTEQDRQGNGNIWYFSSASCYFYCASSYASMVLAVVSLSTVRLSAWHTRALWQNQTMLCRYFNTAQNGNHSSFLTPTVVGVRCPLLSEMCAKRDPPLQKTCTLTDFCFWHLNCKRKNAMQYKSFIHHEMVATTDTQITVKHYKRS